MSFVLYQYHKNDVDDVETVTLADLSGNFPVDFPISLVELSVHKTPPTFST